MNALLVLTSARGRVLSRFLRHVLGRVLSRVLSRAITGAGGRSLSAWSRAALFASVSLPLAALAQSSAPAPAPGQGTGSAAASGQAQLPGLVSRAGAAAPQASLQAGQKLAASGGPNGIAACSGCHGANGEGNAAANFPALAGQPAAYLERQLRGFAGGARNNPVMTPIAKAMSADQQRDASAWYASIAPSAQAPTGGAAGGAGGAGGAAAGQGATAKGAGTNAALLKRGSELAARGDESRQVQACANCHGPGGAGEAPTYPSLRAQPAGYFTATMGEWKSGARKTDPSGQMPSIAQRLDQDQVTALAAYFASLAPSAPAQRINIAAGTQARPAVAARSDGSGPPAGAAATMHTGTGTEQGAPLTGGNQGPGGGGGTKAANPGQAPGGQGQSQGQGQTPAPRQPATAPPSTQQRMLPDEPLPGASASPQAP